MEADKNPFPVIEPFPRLTKIARFMLGVHNPEASYPSEYRHIPEPTDGEAIDLLGYAEISDTLRNGA